MRDTPRTDVETYELDYKVLIPREGGEWVKADFARELEREVAALKADANLLSLNAVIKTLQAEVAALIAERDEYKARCKAQHEVMADMVGKEREADRDRDLRERLVCAALQGAARDAHMHHEASSMGTRAVYIVDAAIAALRKGES